MTTKRIAINHNTEDRRITLTLVRDNYGRWTWQEDETGELIEERFSDRQEAIDKAATMWSGIWEMEYLD